MTMSDAGSSARDAGNSSQREDAADRDKVISEKKSDEPAVAAQAGADAAAAASDSTKPGQTRLEANANEQPEETATAATDAHPDAPDVKKDQTRLPITEKAAVSKPEPPPKRSGQIAAFVSRKDGKLYVRQNFVPLFDVPVTIAPSDRPLGTHVFTARVDKDDANLLHWSVVSLPAASRYAERRDEDERSSRRRKMTGAVETRPVPVPNSAAEALDRIGLPADAMARIAEALSTGGSIVVSDNGIAAGGETGEGTDFVVPLR